MANHPEDTDPKSWHRYFAIESNNRAWEIAEQPSRTPEETAELLNAAHAAALHWHAIGTELNRVRARMLLALAHAIAGFGESALSLIEEVRSHFSTDEVEYWEMALVHSIHAWAAACVGDSVTHREAYKAAESAMDAISDPEEREIVLKTFSQVPSP